jgi:hypothetical protein
MTDYAAVYLTTGDDPAPYAFHAPVVMPLNGVQTISCISSHPCLFIKSAYFSRVEFNDFKDSPLLVLRILTTDNVDVLSSLPFHTLATIAKLLH